MDAEVDKKPTIKWKIIIGILIFFVIVIIALTVGYFIGENHYGSHFLRGTTVNGIDVSGLSVKELDKEIKEYKLTVTERTSDGEYTEDVIKGAQIGLTLISDNQLQKVLKGQKKGKWLSEKGKEYSFETLTEYDEEKWKECLDKLSCFDESFVVKPQNAYVAEKKETDDKFILVKEVEGNQADRELVEKVLSNAVQRLDNSVNLEEEKCYLSPEITEKDKKLKDFCNKLNQYLDVNITYKFDKDTEELTGEDICDWLNIDYKNLTVSLDQDRVSEFVSYLKRNYDSIFTDRVFKTSYGPEVYIEGGDYGWWMNKEEEVAELTAMIEAGKSGERKPVYYQEAEQYGDMDYGNTYVEINLTAQHLFVYVDGQLKLETDFCSGNPSTGHATPAGTYAVTYTQRYATLNGENYSTPVSYWMPFNEDIGLHDATWKTEFGSSFYTYAGSHGCINLPYNTAKEIYQYVYKGMAVVCYHLPGTESTAVTLQTEEEKAQAAIDAISEIATSSNPAKQTKNARGVYNDLRTASVRSKVTNYSDLLYYEGIYGRE